MAEYKELHNSIAELIQEAEKLTQVLDASTARIRELEDALINLNLGIAYNHTIRVENTDNEWIKVTKILAWDRNPQQKRTFRLMYKEIAYKCEALNSNSIEEVVTSVEKPVIEWDIAKRFEIYLEIQNFLNGFTKYLEEYRKEIALTDFHIKV